MAGGKKPELQTEDAPASTTGTRDARSSQVRVARMLADDLRPRRPPASAAMWPAKAMASSDRRITISSGASDLEAIGHMRYELFFSEGGKTCRFVDHSRRQFLEPVDELSLHLQCGTRSDPQAITRLTWASDALSDPHLQVVMEATGAAATTYTIICSRLGVAANTPTQTIILLLRQVYQSALVSGACYCLLTARDDMTGLFETLGFRLLGLSVNDPAGGALSLLKLDAYDVPYLRRHGSPFLAVAEDLFSDEDIA
jgi:hypothetical protein